MDFLQMLMVLFGIACILLLVYLALTGQPIPPAFKAVVLIAVALMFLFCIGHMAGCRVPMPAF